MENRKFTTPVSMECTESQYERDLKQPLKELGYVESDTIGAGSYPNIVLDDDDALCWFCTHQQPTHLTTYNPKLFLALAGMTEGKEPIVGEYVIITTHTLNKPKGFIVKVKALTDFNFIEDGQVDISNPTGSGCFRKATKEELINHFSEKMIIEPPYKLEDLVKDVDKVKSFGYEDGVYTVVFGKDEESVISIMADILAPTHPHYDETMKELLETFNIEFKK